MWCLLCEGCGQYGRHGDIALDPHVDICHLTVQRALGVAVQAVHLCVMSLGVCLYSLTSSRLISFCGTNLKPGMLANTARGLGSKTTVDETTAGHTDRDDEMVMAASVMVNVRSEWPGPAREGKMSTS